MSDTIGSVPPPLGVTPNFEHPKDAFHTTNLILNILCLVIVTPVLLLRLYIRLRIQHIMKREDWACLIAWLIFIPYITSNILMGHFHGGYHQWEVTENDFKQFMAAEYASAVLYGPSVFSIKITLLLIFTRLFAPFRKTILLTYFIMALITCFYIPMLAIKIRMCVPIAGFWDPNIDAKCIDESKLFLADTLMSVVSDTAVLALPLPAVWALNLPVVTRMRILGMLGAGIVATATTVVRLALLVQGGVGTDLTFTVLRFGFLGSAEVSIGLICASLPALNALCTMYKKEKTRNSEPGGDVERDVASSFGSAGKGLKKGSWKTDESILQWTYVDLEGEDAMKADPERDLDRKTIEVDLEKGVNKPLPLLPKIERLSKFKTWEEIRESSESKGRDRAANLQERKNSEWSRDNTRRLEEIPELRIPAKTWEDR